MRLGFWTLPMVPAVLSVTAGYVDTAGFLALHGLFTSHVTGNFVTLSASFAEGASDTIAKLLALPLFCIVVFATRLVRFQFERFRLPILGMWLALQLILMIIASFLAIRFGPFPDANAVPAIAVGLVLVVAMAIQNAFHRIHLANYPPTTIMTGSTTQAMLDLADLFHGIGSDVRPAVTARVVNLLNGIVAFAAGCASAALLYVHIKEGVFVGAPVLGAVTIAFFIWEQAKAAPTGST
jgi:uncharacterized membrane protein YoaK (UPF0700 family)